MLDSAMKIKDQLISWRRDFHMHPELGFEETRTAGIVAEALKEMGIGVETEVGKTGVVGHLGEGPPVVGIRADMDALPLQEANDVPYASQNPGVMHACGHDAHTAILLGVARILSEMPDRPPGEIRFLFQPSEEDWDEELKSGSTRMIEDGALEGLDAVIALHVDDSIPTGQIEINDGNASAAVDSFHATIIGQGGHGAYPHETVDPTFILAQVINAIHGIRARRIKPIDSAVISIGAIHAGHTSNVIPDSVEMMGTIRSFETEVREQLSEELEKAFALSRAFGGNYTLTIEKGFPSMYNDPDVVELICQTASEMLGEDKVTPSEAEMGAEDFSYMSQLAPGAMFWLGVNIDDTPRPAHSPTFDINEDALPIGTALLAEVACRLLISPPRVA
ncbi:MAG: amidohydrolase [Anaerolineales bacterium]|nr:amidohydrolase [Anaerolineales bacterium]